MTVTVKYQINRGLNINSRDVTGSTTQVCDLRCSLASEGVVFAKNMCAQVKGGVYGLPALIVIQGNVPIV